MPYTRSLFKTLFIEVDFKQVDLLRCDMLATIVQSGEDGLVTVRPRTIRPFIV